MQPQERSWQQTIQVEAGQLVEQVKRLIEEGNVRRIRIKQDDRTVVEFPLTFGVVGVVLAPTLAAVGAAAALLTNCTIEVERTESPGGGSSGGSGSEGGQGQSEPASQLVIPPAAGGETASSGGNSGGSSDTSGGGANPPGSSASSTGTTP